MADGLEHVSIAWHPAFCSAAEFDLRNEKEIFSFIPEHNLSREPLRMDLLIIKKNEEASDNDIAKIFRKYNVIEYKSPDDGLTIDDFYKTMAYACLYKGTGKSVDEIPAEELTVSIFREGYPEKLMKTLAADGATMEKTAPGVYEIRNAKFFPAQVIVTGELDPEKHAGFRILSRDAREEDIVSFLEQIKSEISQAERLNIEAILQVSVSANKQTYDNLKRRNPGMCEALRLLMKDEIEEERRKAANEAANEAANRARLEQAKEIALALSKKGDAVDVIADVIGVTEDVIRTWLGMQTA